MALRLRDEMRIIGLDLGEKRIGVAAADDRTPVAVPVGTVEADGDAVGVVRRLVEEQQADEVVIGLPLSMTGAMGPQAQQAMNVVEALRERLDVPVYTWDERLTTVQASRSLGASRRGGREKQKGARDAIAAAILLQAYLDSRRRPD
jgi:putative Holliday junction resolvase